MEHTPALALVEDRGNDRRFHLGLQGWLPIGREIIHQQCLARFDHQLFQLIERQIGALTNRQR